MGNIRVICSVDFSEVLSKLERMEKVASEEIVKNALEEAGKYVKMTIIAEAPYDTGALRQAIDYRFKDANLIEVGVEYKTNPRTFLYSVYNEYGTHKMSKVVAPLHRNMY